MWINKKHSLKQLHLQVFELFKHILQQWVDYKDPQCEKVPKDPKKDLRKILVDFPYRPKGWNDDKPFTRKDFDSMSLEDQFQMCMGGVLADPKIE